MKREKIKKSKFINIRGQWVLENQSLIVNDVIENINGNQFKILKCYNSKGHYRDMFLLEKLETPNKGFQFEFCATSIINSDYWFKVIQ